MIVKVSSKGQVVVPREIREKMGIEAGAFLEFKQVDDKHLEITVIRDLIKELGGSLKGSNLTKQLEEEHREEIKQDEIRARRMGGSGMARKRRRKAEG